MTQAISVVIPAFNVERWIGEALHSVVKQDPPPDEIVVVDDGSVDGTVERARSVEGPIRIVTQQNGGLSSARNLGAMSSRNEMLLFLDADDVLLPGTIDHMVNVRSGLHEEAGILIPNHHRGSDRTDSLAWPSRPEVRVLGRGDLVSIIRKNWLLSNAFVTRDVWASLRFDEGLLAVEDLDFFARALLAGVRIAVLGRPGVVMSVRREGSLTRQTKLMRTYRRRAFRKLAAADLAPIERAWVMWQLARSTIGERAAGA